MIQKLVHGWKNQIWRAGEKAVVSSIYWQVGFKASFRCGVGRWIFDRVCLCVIVASKPPMHVSSMCTTWLQTRNTCLPWPRTQLMVNWSAAPLAAQLNQFLLLLHLILFSLSATFARFCVISCTAFFVLQSPKTCLNWKRHWISQGPGSQEVNNKWRAMTRKT